MIHMPGNMLHQISKLFKNDYRIIPGTRKVEIEMWNEYLELISGLFTNWLFIQ